MFEQPGATGTSSIRTAERRDDSRSRGRRCADGHHEIDSSGCGSGGQGMDAKYAVIFERAENNWAAYVPDLPGCMTTGRTLEETKVNICEAIHGHLETMHAYGSPIPEPTSLPAQLA